MTLEREVLSERQRKSGLRMNLGITEGYDARPAHLSLSLPSLS